MPGFNQQGPMNQGPMTGKGRGTCTDAHNFGPGTGRGRGCRRGRARTGEPGGYGPGFNANQGAYATDDLLNRKAMLEAELKAVKEQIKNQADTGE